MSNSDITSKYEAERLRAAEQSQIVYLQGQIDELRRQLKEQTNKYNWAMEQVRKVETSVAQIDGILDRHRQEISQALEIYRRDIIGLRKEVAGALVKVDEGQKPIREMQAQIHQLGEVRKQDRDYVAGWLVRIDELDERTRSWKAQIREVEDRYRSTIGQFEALAAADEVVRAEARKINEDLQIEKQSIRRQAVEAQQLVTGLHSIFEEHESRIARIDEIRQQIELFAAQIPGQIVALDSKISEQVGEIKRVERLATERFLMNQERLEELRQQQDERLVSLHDVDEQHQRQFTSWLERVDGLVRELEQRLARATARLEVVQREQAGQLVVLERRDVQIVEAVAATWREVVERIRTEQIELGPFEPGKA